MVRAEISCREVTVNGGVAIDYSFLSFFFFFANWIGNDEY